VAQLKDLRLDSALSVNVLEHIDDDTAALRAMWSFLAPGNTMTVFVPAFPSIFGAMDVGVGHVRRYRKRELVAKVQAAGFSVLDVRYVNLPGFFAWFINGRVLRRNQPLGGSRLVAFYDRTVIMVARLVESVIRPPFGQSLFLAARRD
jgi:SAM-dependent methyltransferase